MSVGSIIGGGLRLVRTQPWVVAIWTGLYLALTIVGMIVSRPWMAAMMALQQQQAANRAAGITTPPAFPTEAFGQMLVFELAFLVLSVIAFAAVVRAVARPGGDRFAYLRLGMDELRLIGLAILFLIAGLVAEIVAVLAIGVIAMVVGLIAGKLVGIIPAVLLAIALFCGAVYVEVRLSLAGALTVIQRRIVIRDAWRATQGHFWTLFGAYLVLSIGLSILSLVAFALINPHLLAAYASLDHQAMMAAAQNQMAQQNAGLSVAMIVQFALGSIMFVVAATVACGAVATAAVELGNRALLDIWA